MSDPPAPASRTAAVLVVYHWTDSIEGLLQRLATSVAVTIVIDNHEQPHAALPEMARRHRAGCSRNGNRGGLAGAYNLALDLLRRDHADELDQVVFVDDDSDPTVLSALLADAWVRLQLQDERTAAVAPAYRDKATGLRGKYIELGRFGLTYLSREFTDPKQVAFVINSMSVWRVDALLRIGRFNEDLAIDHVDTEYCLRARACGLSVWVHGGYTFAHAIGHRRTFKLLGRVMQAGGHPPARRRTIGRNTAWLARTWLWREPAFALLCLSRLAYEAVGIVMAEDRKPAKLWALARGAVSGLFLRLRT